MCTVRASLPAHVLALLNVRLPLIPAIVSIPASVLAPLKRYGNYPPEEREKGDHDHDDGGSESDVPVRAGRRKEQEKDKDKEGLLPPAVVKLKYSVVDEGPSSLKIIVEVCMYYNRIFRYPRDSRHTLA